MADVFISHSSIDKELADKVCETLEAKGLKCWIAPRDIMPGSEWAVAISNAISVVRAMVVIYSKNSAQSTQVPKEIALAEKRGKFILPYKIDDAELEGAFDYYLTGAHWIVANPEREEYKLEEMYGVLAGVLQMPTQTITTNLYIDNVTIQSPAPEEKKDRENAAKEKTVEEEAGTEEMVMPVEKKQNSSGKRWFWIAGIMAVILLGIAVFLVVMLIKPEEDDDDDWDEYEEGDEWEENDPEENDPDENDPDDWDTDESPIEDFSYNLEDEGIVIYEYIGTDEYVVVPDIIDGEQVTVIDAFAFSEKDVISVTIPEGVTLLGYGAFYECKQLKTVVLPESLLVIEEWAFSDTALEELVIPDGVEEIKDFAFQNSSNIVVYYGDEVYTYEEAMELIISTEE